MSSHFSHPQKMVFFSKHSQTTTFNIFYFKQCKIVLCGSLSIMIFGSLITEVLKNVNFLFLSFQIQISIHNQWLSHASFYFHCFQHFLQNWWMMMNWPISEYTPLFLRGFKQTFLSLVHNGASGLFNRYFVPNSVLAIIWFYLSTANSKQSYSLFWFFFSLAKSKKKNCPKVSSFLYMEAILIFIKR